MSSSTPPCSPSQAQALLPARFAGWEYMDYKDGDDVVDALVDDVWHVFEPFLASRGYQVCWSRTWVPGPSNQRPVATTFEPAVKALAYPSPRNPSMPSSEEGFVVSIIRDGPFEYSSMNWVISVSINSHTGCPCILKSGLALSH